jgi:lauroyl/myristoyl acyltransferase
MSRRHLSSATAGISVATLADRSIDAAAALLSRCMPASMHPGRRACRSIAEMPATRAWATERLARAILANRWRSALLFREVRRLSRRKLQRFLDSHVQIYGVQRFVQACETRRPLVLATLHTEGSVLACLIAAQRLAADRRFAILYQQTARSAGLPALISRTGLEVTLLSGVGGIVRALELLKDGGCIATMPDAFLDVADTLAVPFLGRWLRVAGGLAYLAHRAGALILPSYSRVERGLMVRIEVGPPIDAGIRTDADERQSTFTLTSRLFAELERRIARAPEHWLYLDRLARLSTPMELPRDTPSSELVCAIASRCRAFPVLLRRAPALAQLIDQVTP